MSGKHPIILALVALLAFAGCRDAGEAKPSPEAAAKGAAAITAKRIEPDELDTSIAPGGGDETGTLEARPGNVISADEARYTLPMLRDGRVLQPVAAAGTRFLIQEQPASQASSASELFELWDPATGQFEKAWEGVEGRQDIIGGVSGDWVATVRTSESLPFAEWSVILRNLETGENRTLASADTSAEATPGLQPDLPLGFAPLPSISGDLVTWDEHFANDGGAGKRILVYDIETGVSREVASVSDATREDLRLPAVGGQLVAWVHRDLVKHTATVETFDLVSGKRATPVTHGNPWSVALSADGAILAWDDNLTAKYAMRLDSGEVTRFATNEGWGTTTNGTAFSWMPAAAQGGTGGFYDSARNQVRLLPKKQAVASNVAGLLGDWFVWQEVSRGDLADAKYYFLPLQP